MRRFGNKAVNAVIGVILMITITISFAVVVYVYVESIMPEEISEEDYIYKTGVLKGFYDVGCGDPIIIGNESLDVYHIDESYLENFLGKDITLILAPFDDDYYEYQYIGAYLN